MVEPVGSLSTANRELMANLPVRADSLTNQRLYLSSRADLMGAWVRGEFGLCLILSMTGGGREGPEPFVSQG